MAQESTSFFKKVGYAILSPFIWLKDKIKGVFQWLFNNSSAKNSLVNLKADSSSLRKDHIGSTKDNNVLSSPLSSLESTMLLEKARQVEANSKKYKTEDIKKIFGSNAIDYLSTQKELGDVIRKIHASPSQIASVQHKKELEAHIAYLNDKNAALSAQIPVESFEKEDVNLQISPAKSDEMVKKEREEEALESMPNTIFANLNVIPEKELKEVFTRAQEALEQNRSYEKAVKKLGGVIDTELYKDEIQQRDLLQQLVNETNQGYIPQERVPHLEVLNYVRSLEALNKKWDIVKRQTILSQKEKTKTVNEEESRFLPKPVFDPQTTVYTRQDFEKLKDKIDTLKKEYDIVCLSTPSKISIDEPGEILKNAQATMEMFLTHFDRNQNKLNFLQVNYENFLKDIKRYQESSKNIKPISPIVSVTKASSESALPVKSLSYTEEDFEKLITELVELEKEYKNSNQKSDHHPGEWLSSKIKSLRKWMNCFDQEDLRKIKYEDAVRFIKDYKNFKNDKEINLSFENPRRSETNQEDFEQSELQKISTRKNLNDDVLKPLSAILSAESPEMKKVKEDHSKLLQLFNDCYSELEKREKDTNDKGFQFQLTFKRFEIKHANREISNWSVDQYKKECKNLENLIKESEEIIRSNAIRP